MLNAKSVANYFIEMAKASGQPLDPMKLQKLIYYAHGWYAGYTESPLINESVEAWPYGPVIPSVYHEFKKFGAGQITEKAKDFINGVYCEVPPPGVPSIVTFLGNVWASYGKFTGVTLSEMTHAQGTPWYLTRVANPNLKGVDIPFNLIKEHFKGIVNKTST